MIKSLPSIYPNELFSSYLARLFAHSGFIYHMGIANEIFCNPNEYVNYNFVNSLSNDFLTTLQSYIKLEDIILEHTLFKYYARFLPYEKRRKAWKIALANCENLSPRFVSIPNCKSNYYLRYCPKCVEEDRKKYGECYLHVEHQIPELTCCPVHKVKLVNTRKDNSNSHDSTLWPLESLLQSLEAKPATALETKIAKYIFDSLKYKLNIKNKVPIGSFLTEKLDSKYFPPRGEQKDLMAILNDIGNYYKDLDAFNITRGRLATIYRNEYINVFDIYLIAIFEKISVKKLCEFSKLKPTRSETFDNKVRSLFKSGKTQAEIAKILKVNHEVVRQVLLGTYDKVKSKTVRFRHKKWEWEKIDEQCCNKFEKVVARRYFANTNVPITKATISKLFNLKDYTLRNLPRLKKSIHDFKQKIKL